MPRRAAADFGFPTSTSERLRPPDELSPGSPERDVFLDTVTACSPDHFRPAEIHLLVTFCEAVVRKRVATGELRERRRRRRQAERVDHRAEERDQRHHRHLAPVAPDAIGPALDADQAARRAAQHLRPHGLGARR